LDNESGSKATPPLDFAEDKLAHKLWRFNHPPNRFGETFRAELDAAANVEVWLHANVVDIETDPHGARVTGFKIATLDGKTAHVSARYFILAAGGLENPRLLLNADAANPAGLGNDHDLVGRYFADHLNAVAGQVAVSKPGWQDAYDYYWLDAVRGRKKVRASPKAQSSKRILNSAAQLGPLPTARRASKGFRALRAMRDDVRRGRFPDELGRRIIDVATDLDGIWGGFVEYFGDQGVSIEIEGEQAPNPDSRVRLMNERDALGLRRIQLDWRLSPIDRDSILGLVQLIGEEVGRLGVGRVLMADWLLESGDAWPDGDLGGNHHIGATRMANHPAEGVVDADCRVFGVDNLFIAGSSVFPTSGVANPTLTIVALAIRLADHIDDLAAHRK
jgi:choline dehydrogenase-like flavoprotein